MSVNYNTIKTMRGMSVGTIIPWSGPISGDFGVPRGWLICKGNVPLKITDYPELYEIIGTRYGGTVASGTFNLPNLPGKILADYHPSHSSSQGYTGNFASFLGTNDDVANQTLTTQSSNIDCRLTLDPIQGELKANLEGMQFQNAKFVTTFGFVERRLGDGHHGSHSHEGSYPSIRVTNSRIEACQNNTSANCFSIFGIPDCSDDCDNSQLYRCGNANNATDDFCVPKYDGGEHLGRGRVPYGTSGYRMVRTDSPRNYILPTDDCLLYNETSAQVGTGNDGAWEGIYATTLSSDIVNFQNASMTGHIHTTQSCSVDPGNIRAAELVRINTISTGDIAPVNQDNREVMTITATTNTATLQMVYIIKAY